MQDQHTASLEKQNSREDFNKYFLNVANFKNLAEDCINGNVKNFNCRWTAWRAYLGLLTVGDEAKMREEVKKQRAYYAGEYDKYVNYRSKSKLGVMDDNPLSQSDKNPWNSFYGDSELKDEIKKDIERTYQDLEFFIDKKTQQVLTNVLFIWSKQHPDLSYRQGMNELVAVLTYACYTENYKPENPATDIYDYLNDEKFAEADIYTAYKRLMELDQKQMFVVTPPPTKGKPKKKTDSDAPARPNLPVVHRAAYIQEELLPQFHPQVFNHLKSLQVEPHIYMMRWLRCILVREFKIVQALQVWDSIFGYHYQHPPATKKLEMLDYMCITMIINLSQELIEIDNNGMALGKLLRYPPTENINQFINTCHEEVLNVLNSEGFGAPKETVNNLQSAPQKDERKSPVDVAPQEDNSSKSPVPAGGSKKIVLFNNDMSLFKGDKPLPEDKSPEKKAKATPTFKEEAPVKKPESDKFANKPTLFSASPIDKLLEEAKKVVQYINPKPAETQKEQGETVVFSQTKAFGAKEEPALTKTVSTEAEKPKPVVEQKSGPVLFSSSDKAPIRNPFASNSVAKETKNDIIPGVNNTQKDVNDGIKKLQNALKLMKLENEKNQSLGLKEAIDDVNEVLKMMKERLSKH